MQETAFVIKYCTWTSEAVSGVLTVIKKTQVYSGLIHLWEYC